MPLPHSHITTAAVNCDLRRYRDLLASNGKALDSTAQDKLYQFASFCYAGNGRTDFWVLSSDYQVNSGTTCYSWLGKQGNLIDGPTWGPLGISTNSTSVIRALSIIDSPSAFVAVCASHPTTHAAQWPWLMSLSGGADYVAKTLGIHGEADFGASWGSRHITAGLGTQTSKWTRTNTAFYTADSTDTLLRSTKDGANIKTAAISDPLTTNYDRFAIGGRYVSATAIGTGGGVTGFTGTVHFFLVSPTIIDYSALYAVYKRTIGDNITGLP